MKNLPLVALVGATNAGKSSLFNRLGNFSRTDGAIVAREAGTTRDSVIREISSEFVLVDTAGLKDPEDDFETTIQDQVSDAIDAADLILLVKDATEFATNDDKTLAKKILKSRKPVILILNKMDLKNCQPREEFLRLGIRDIIQTSAEHNQNIAKLRQMIREKLLTNNTGVIASVAKQSTNSRKNSGDNSADDFENDFTENSEGDNGDDNYKNDGDENPENNFAKNPIKLALVGRPNVGKSNLFNILAKKQQAIVAPVAGTTRDINRVKVKFHGREIELLDTAGVRRNGKIEQGIEKFSVLRTVAAIEESDICLLLVDVGELATALDQKLAGMIAEAGKGLILVVSKWDLAKSIRENSNDSEDDFAKNTQNSQTDSDNKNEFFAATDQVIAKLKSVFDFLPWAPVIFTSSKTGQNVAKIFEIATKIQTERLREIPTRKLNDLLQKTVAKHPPAGLKNTFPKMRYVVQTDVAPPWFVIYGSNFKFIHWSYKRFLENSFRENFGFTGTPIKFSFRDEKQIRENNSSRKNGDFYKNSSRKVDDKNREENR